MMEVSYMAVRKSSRTFTALVLALVAVGCGGNKITPPACVPAAAQQFAYQLNSNDTQISMFSINSCTGAFASTTPATVATGVSPGQIGAEDMVVDPLGRFAYVANLISNSSDQATISMYTINPATGVLSPTNPATVHTGFFPQGIAIDPMGKFVYTANSDDDSVSMFTIDAATGILTPTTPAAVPAGKGPLSVTIDHLGKFAYVPDNVVNRVSQFTVDPNTGLLNPISPSSVATGQGPTAVAVDPSGKFAYVVNRIDNTVSMFTIDAATGSLTQQGVIATG